MAVKPVCSKFRASQVIGFLSLMILSVGCKGTLAPGHYEGNLVQILGDSRDQEPVKIEVIQTGKEAFQIGVRELKGAERLSISVRLLKSRQMEVSSLYLNSGVFLADPVDPREFQGIDKDEGSYCYLSSGAKSLELCFKSDRFFLQLVDSINGRVVELSGNSFSEEQQFNLERPVVLTLTDSVKLSFQQNFNSRTSYQKVVQARLAALAAYLNLVPHLTTNLIWNAAPNYITYIATLQGLVPFLLPSFWLQAREETIQSDIQEMALLIMRANLASTVEELTYALKRDMAIVSDLRSYLEEVREFRLSFLLTQGLSDEQRQLLRELADFIEKALASDIGDITKLIRQDRYSLAQTLGFHNIEAVIDVDIDQENLLIDAALPIDPAEMADLASQRSFELKQMDDLKKIAELKKIENYFIWLDPQGDPKQSFGANTFPQQKSAKSRMLEIEIERDQTKTNIYQNAYKLALDFNESIQSYRTVNEALDSVHFRLKDLLVDVVAGKPIHSDHLRWNAQKYSASLVAKQVTLANFRIARAKKDRLLLGGYYSQILPRLLGDSLHPRL